MNQTLPIDQQSAIGGTGVTATGTISLSPGHTFILELPQRHDRPATLVKAWEVQKAVHNCRATREDMLWAVDNLVALLEAE